MNSVSTVPTVPIAALVRLGGGLRRPECVVPTADGSVLVPHWPGGVTRVSADGTTEHWLAAHAPIDLRPNGIAVADDGAFLIANLGDDGGVWRLDRSGQLTPVVLEADGLRLPPTNFVTVDGAGRMWISVSTRMVPRQQAWRDDIADGFVVCADSTGAHIVADGLHYTNEVRPDPSGQWLYVVETFGRRIRRWPIRPGVRLGAPEVIYGSTDEFFPDGFAFDEDGGLWVTSLVSNRLIRLAGGTAQVVLEDRNAEFIRSAEDAFASRTMTAAHLGPIPGTTIQQLTSVGLGGPDGRTVYLGTLHGTAVYTFRTTVRRA